MHDNAAQIDNIRSPEKAKKPRVFTSVVSATAIVCLFVVLGVRLLEVI